MSLLNSAINQIGREIGRDVYRSLKTNSNDPSNNTILQEIKSFELSAYDRVSVRNLSNLVEKTDDINPKEINALESFFELEDKIDWCRENLKDEFNEDLDRLFKLNELNYKICLDRHKRYIDSLIENLSTNISKYEGRNKVTSHLSNFTGWSAIVVLYFLIKNYDNLYVNTGIGHFWFWTLMVLIGLPLSLYGFSNILSGGSSSKQEQYTKNKKYLENLKKYSDLYFS